MAQDSVLWKLPKFRKRQLPGTLIFRKIHYKNKKKSGFTLFFGKTIFLIPFF